METITPIVAGALYRVVGGEDVGDLTRVKSVWVDEDHEVQVQLFDDDGYTDHRPSRTVDLESFIEQIDDTIIRVNSDHEAWEWRN